jgi:putative endopeptidase
MDPSVAPGADFARFAAGGWYTRTTIPADKSRWGGFDELAERNWGHVRALVEAAAANPGAAGSNTQKVGDLFASALDVAMINARGLQPIEPMLARIAAVTTREELVAICAEMHLELGNPLLGMAFYADQ